MDQGSSRGEAVENASSSSSVAADRASSSIEESGEVEPSEDEEDIQPEQEEVEEADEPSFVTPQYDPYALQCVEPRSRDGRCKSGRNRVRLNGERCCSRFRQKDIDRLLALYERVREVHATWSRKESRTSTGNTLIAKRTKDLDDMVKELKGFIEGKRQPTLYDPTDDEQFSLYHHMLQAKPTAAERIRLKRLIGLWVPQAKKHFTKNVKGEMTAREQRRLLSNLKVFMTLLVDAEDLPVPGAEYT